MKKGCCTTGGDPERLLAMKISEHDEHKQVVDDYGDHLRIACMDCHVWWTVYPEDE